VPVVPTATSTGGVTQLPNTGSSDAGGSADWLLPAGIVGAAAAIAARLGLRSARRDLPE
jgi:hypothetical protein